MPRAEPEALHEPFRKPRQSVRCCDHPGCTEEGAYPAPRSRQSLRDYYYFCLDHVRAYNRSWDYFKDMNQEEIEAEQRRDQTWQRPSWPLGGNIHSAGYQAKARQRMRDPFGFFAEEEAAAAEEKARRQREAERDEEEPWRGSRGGTAGRAMSEEAQALATLDLDPPVTFDTIKSRYKALVKRLHPDVNGGDSSQEDRLKAVNQAYATLRSAYARLQGAR